MKSIYQELDALTALLERYADGNEAMRLARWYQPYPLKLGYSSYAEGIRAIAEKYRSCGLEAEVIDFPADGKTVYADRHFPLCWDVLEAYADAGDLRIVDYEKAPYGVIPFSADSGGVREAVLIPLEDLPEGGLQGIAPLITHYPSGAEIREIMERGAEAFFSVVNLEPIHPSLDEGRRWYNDLFAPGQIDQRDRTICGFSITPKDARELMRRYHEGGPVGVTYLLRSKAYEGTLPVVTAVIPGENTDRCFFITSHGYEPHGTNNVAGISSCLMLAETLSGMIRDGILPRPKYSIRFFHGLEVFGVYSFGMRNREIMKNAVGGVSMDSFGRKEAGGFREHFVLRRCLSVHPSWQHALAGEILDRVCRTRGISFEVRESSSNNEEMMQDPGFGPAWNLLYGSLWEEPRSTYPRCYFYHTDVDTVDALEPSMLSAGAVFAGTLALAAGFLENAADRDSMVGGDWIRITKEKCREALRLQARDTESVSRRVKRLMLWRDISVASMRSQMLEPANYLAVRSEMLSLCGGAAAILGSGEDSARTAGGNKAALPPEPGNAPSGTTAEDPYENDPVGGKILRRLVPGPLGLGTIPEECRELAIASQGYDTSEYWCLDPSGANLFLIDGKRTVEKVAMAAWATRAFGETETKEDVTKERKRYYNLAKVLLSAGLAEEVVPPRPDRAAVTEGLRELGIKPGDTVFLHASLSAFGHLEGGAEALAGAFEDAVTEDGIFAMPAFSDCVEGGMRGAYDPEETLPDDWIGKVSVAFWKMPGVLRSAHPTHSVLAWGNGAAEYLSQEEPYDCFAKDGPFGKLVSRDGWIVCTGSGITSLTFIHYCEARYNTYLDGTTALVRDGDGVKHVTVSNYPGGCRGGWYKLGFDAPYLKELFARNIFESVRVGGAMVYAVRARKLEEAMKEIFAKDPFILLHKDGCRECARFRATRKDADESL